MRAIVRAVVALLAASLGLASLSSAEPTSGPLHEIYAYDIQHRVFRPGL